MYNAGEGFENVEIEELKKIIKDERFIFFIGMVFPPISGVMSFFTKLEHGYFPPGTKKNEDFIMMISVWKETNWAIAGIPKGYMGVAKKIAKSFGLKIVDKIPYILGMLGKGNIEQFPFNGKNVFTLEEEKEINSIIKNKENQKEEKKEVKIIWDEEE